MPDWDFLLQVRNTPEKPGYFFVFQQILNKKIAEIMVANHILIDIDF